MPSPAAGITAFVTLVAIGRRYPSTRHVVAVGAGVESELFAAEQSLEIRRMARHDEHGDRGDHRDVTPRMSGERDREGKRDDHHDRRERRLVRESHDDEPHDADRRA